MMNTYYIGVDAGGTKTAFVLVNDSAEIISQYTGSAGNYLVNGLEMVVDVLVSGINKLLFDGAINSNQIKGAYISIAGFKDIDEDVIPITKLMEERLPINNFVLGNDVENAFAGSLGGRTGIQIIAGTGSIGFGKNENNETFRSGGWHHVMNSDEGSGYWIAVKLLQAFSKQADYRMPRTLLYEHIRKVLNLKNDYDAIKIITSTWNSDRTKIASLANECTILARQGDQVAIDIFNEAVVELSLIILAIKKKLMPDKHVNVSYGGGVFNADKYMVFPLKQILQEENCTLVKPLYSPLAGSVILALQVRNIKITTKIKRNLEKI